MGVSTYGVRRTMKKNLIVVFVGVVLALSSCGNGASSGAVKAPGPSAPATATSESTEMACIDLQQSDFNLLTLGWSIVVASRGSSDHPRYVIGFLDSVSDLLERFKRGNCNGTDTMNKLLELNYAATVLATPYKIVPQSDPATDQYGDVEKVGNQLLKLVGSTGTKFIPITCTGKADKAPECTALPIS